jgi:hypothetical protein
LTDLPLLHILILKPGRCPVATKGMVVLIVAGILGFLVISYGDAEEMVLEVYNPAGVNQDGVFVDKLLKKIMQEEGKTRPPFIIFFHIRTPSILSKYTICKI